MRNPKLILGNLLTAAWVRGDGGHFATSTVYVTNAATIWQPLLKSVRSSASRKGSQTLQLTAKPIGGRPSNGCWCHKNMIEIAATLIASWLGMFYYYLMRRLTFQVLAQQQETKSPGTKSSHSEGGWIDPLLKFPILVSRLRTVFLAKKLSKYILKPPKCRIGGTPENPEKAQRMNLSRPTTNFYVQEYRDITLKLGKGRT